MKTKLAVNALRKRTVEKAIKRGAGGLVQIVSRVEPAIYIVEDVKGRRWLAEWQPVLTLIAPYETEEED